MKSLKLLFAVSLVAILSACASTTAPSISSSNLAHVTHADLQAAAGYATAHGYPEVAAVYMADDAKLTAINAQIDACLSAINASLPQQPAPTGSVGPILAFEMAREAVGNFSGIPAKVKILCEPLPVPALPVMPKLP